MGEQNNIGTPAPACSQRKVKTRGCTATRIYADPYKQVQLHMRLASRGCSLMCFRFQVIGPWLRPTHSPTALGTFFLFAAYH